MSGRREDDAVRFELINGLVHGGSVFDVDSNGAEGKLLLQPGWSRGWSREVLDSLACQSAARISCSECVVVTALDLKDIKIAKRC